LRIDVIQIGNDPPHDVNVIVEVPLGGQPIKYEMDKEAGMLVVDRFVYTSMAYPGNYGFVPRTLSEDGDAIDVLVCNTRPLVPGCLINVRPIGVLVMEDNAGHDEEVGEDRGLGRCRGRPLGDFRGDCARGAEGR
jgi:inorganic pyrophosphatase